MSCASRYSYVADNSYIIVVTNDLQNAGGQSQREKARRLKCITNPLRHGGYSKGAFLSDFSLAGDAGRNPIAFTPHTTRRVSSV